MLKENKKHKGSRVWFNQTFRTLFRQPTLLNEHISYLNTKLNSGGIT